MTPTTTLTPIERREHCAKFSEPILAGLTEITERLDPDRTWRILDPFAGVGLIHSIANGRRTVASELEPEWAIQGLDLSPNTLVARAQWLPFPDGVFDAIITSPCYGNRMGDTYDGNGVCRRCHGHPLTLGGETCDRCGGEGRDTSKRYTYTTSLGRRLTHGSGAGMQWGPDYRTLHRAAWREATRVLRPRGWFILNISDHLRSDGRGNQVRVPVARWHYDHLVDHLRYTPVSIRNIATDRSRNGANRDARVEAEHLVILRAAA